MDADDLRNWGYYDCHSLNRQGGMQILSNIPDVKPNEAFNPRDYSVSTSQYPMNSMRGAWIHGESNFFDTLPTNPGYSLTPETSTTRDLPVQQVVHLDEIVPKSESRPKPKKSKKADPNAPAQRAKCAKKVTEVLINGINMDISSIPIPVCSCTATPQQCYRWGSGGWQSACCTTGMSQYPLPMSTKRRGARIAGRKMSLGAFKKVLEKLAAEGYDFSNPIDLRSYWAKHGTNKFVTIR